MFLIDHLIGNVILYPQPKITSNNNNSNIMDPGTGVVGQPFIGKSESSTLLIQQPSVSATGSVSGQLFYNALAGRLLYTNTTTASTSNHPVPSYNMLNDNAMSKTANCGPNTIQLSTQDSVNLLFANTGGMAQVCI